MGWLFIYSGYEFRPVCDLMHFDDAAALRDELVAVAVID